MEQQASASLVFGDFVIDRSDERLIGPHGPVRLGNKAFKVLLMLAEQHGRLLTKDAFFASVWDGTTVSESSLTSAVKELRRALGDDTKTPRYIESVYGRGYRFVAAVSSGVPEQAGQNANGAPARPEPQAVSEPSPGSSQPPLVLVSVFNDDAVRAAHPYCAAELREEILSGLARVREIQLVADDRPEEEASRERRSESGYQLTATLLPDGPGVKVIARVKRLADGVVVWGEAMSLANGGTAGGVDKIVRRIVGAALPAVDDDVLQALPKDGGEIYGRYLLAKRRSLVASSYAEAKAAADALEEIIAERPDFSLAYPPLVRLLHTDFGYTAYGSTGDKERARGLELARAGLAADRANAHALSVLGWCHLWRNERALADKAFKQALALNPYNHVRIQEVATAWMYFGDVAAARDLLERAADLNPTPDDNFYEDWGRLRFIEGDYEGALNDLEAMAKRSVWAELYLAASEIALGRETGKLRLRAWRDRVDESWHGGAPPEDGELLGWIERHSILPPASRADLLRRIREALDLTAGTGRSLA